MMNDFEEQIKINLSKITNHNLRKILVGNGCIFFDKDRYCHSCCPDIDQNFILCYIICEYEMEYIGIIISNKKDSKYDPDFFEYVSGSNGKQMIYNSKCFILGSHMSNCEDMISLFSSLMKTYHYDGQKDNFISIRNLMKKPDDNVIVEYGAKELQKWYDYKNLDITNLDDEEILYLFLLRMKSTYSTIHKAKKISFSDGTKCVLYIYSMSDDIYMAGIIHLVNSKTKLALSCSTTWALELTKKYVSQTFQCCMVTKPPKNISKHDHLMEILLDNVIIKC